MKSRRPSLILAASCAALLSSTAAHAGNTWDGGSTTTNNWSDNANWNPDGQPGYGTLTFSGSTRTTNVNDNITAMNGLFWTGSSAWTLNQGGTTVLSLFDNGGVQAKIENQSSGLVTINAPITFAATTGSNWGEINAVNGNITFGSGTLTVNGSAVNGIRMFGGGRTTTFNNTVSAANKYFSTSAVNTTVAIGGAFTSGDFYLMNSGTLKLNTGANFTTGSGALRLGGDFGTTGTQNQTLGATLQLTSATGGLTVNALVNTVTGNTSGALLIDSQNTSGLNTLAGDFYLDSDLKVQQAAGGTVVISDTTADLKNQTLTVLGNGTVGLSGVVGNSTGSGKITVGTDGTASTGTLKFSSVNTYTGDTTVRSGTLEFGTATASSNNSTIRLGSTSGASVNASINLSVASGGQTIASVVNPVATSGTGALSINSQNSTGTNILSGHFGLDRNLTINQTAGGSLTINSVHTTADTGNLLGIDIKGNTLTLAGGNITVSGATGTSANIYSSTGTGNVTVSSGSVTLSGVNTYTGATTIKGGTLALGSAGTFANSATIVVGDAGSSGAVLDLTAKTGSFNFGSGQTVKGIGTINIGAGKTVVNSGILAPGNSIGTLAVTGNYTFATGSTYQVETDATSADRINISGSASIASGANISFTGTTGLGKYVLGTAASGFNSGTFNVTGAVPTGYNLVYSATELDLQHKATIALTNNGTPSNQNVHVGSTAPISVNIANSAPVNSANLNFTLGGNTTISNSGTIGAGSSNNASGTYTAAAAGVNSVTVSATDPGATNSPQTLNYTVTGYNYASANTLTTPVNLGNSRVGGTLSQAIGLTNTAPTGAFTEKLDGAITGSAGNASGSGSVSLLAAGSSSNNITGSLSTAAAGAKSGTVTVGLTSNGTGTSGLANTALPSQTVSLSGAAYDFASPTQNTAGPVNFGYIHVGAANGTGSVSITNTTITNAAYQDSLNASASSNNGKVTGNSTNIAAGNTGSLTLTANASTVGSLASTVSLGYVSNANGVAGLSNQALSGGSIATTGQVYSGQGVWASNTSGNWGNFDKWEANGGAPGLDANFQTTDSATFGSANNAGAVAVSLTGVNPSVNAVTFDSANTYTLNGTGTLTLNNGASAANLSVVNGSHVINTAVNLKSGLALNTSSNGSVVVGGSVSSTGAHGLTKTGDGLAVLAAANTFTGATAVSGGTLRVENGGGLQGTLQSTSSLTVNGGASLELSGSGSADRINNSASVNLSGGTLLSSDGASEGVAAGGGAASGGFGTLTLGNGLSYIDFGDSDNTVFSFADSRSATWLSGSLTILNWNGTVGVTGGDGLYFGSTAAALTTAQLSQIKFDINGIMYGAQINGVGEVYALTAVPEPTTVMGGLLLIGLLGYRERRRFTGLVSRRTLVAA